MSASPSRVAIGLLLALLFWGLVAWRLSVLQYPLSGATQGTAEDQQLFDQALAQGLLVAQANGELQPLPRDELLARRQRGEPLPEETERLFSRLYHGQAGKAVRAELRRWNRSRSLAAVRDNSAQFPEVSYSGWAAYHCDGGKRALGGLVPEPYGFLHQGRLRTGFGPWLVAAGSGCVEFRTRFFAPLPQELVLWMVGQPDDLRSVTAISPLKPAVAQACEQQATEQQAAQMVVTKSSWRKLEQNGKDMGWQRELRVRLKPVAYHGTRVAGLKVAIDPESCRFVWLDSGVGTAAKSTTAGTRRVARGGFSLLSGDGVALLDARGRPTAEARELGLLPLVGYGRGDYHSLGGLLARSALPSAGFSTRLTLDSRLQAAARQHLRAGVERQFPMGEDPFALQRRAAMVVLNGRSGAILAAAGLPEVPSQGLLEDWDLAAFARTYPASDPLRVRAWDSALDKHDVPGSTFKQATALAALGKAGEDEKVAGMLRGWGAETFVEETGLALTATSYDPYAEVPAGSPDGRSRKLSNFMLNTGKRENFMTLIDHPRLHAAECPAPPVDSKALALPSAVRDSLNVWFARLALMVDGDAMAKLDHEVQPDPPSRFTQTLRTLGFDQSLDLLAQAPAFVSDAGRPRLPAARVSLWADNPRPARWVLAQNAIGQGVSVTALHMASLAAGIASGRVVQPYLVADWHEQTVTPPPGPLLPGDLDLLRAGMHAVPQVGTAKKAFAEVFADRPSSPLRCNTFAKTGTAEVAPDEGGGVEKFNSAWFVGWHQPAEGDPLVFACMVSHAHGRGSRTGGQVCAPIVARYLNSIYPPPAAVVEPSSEGVAVLPAETTESDSQEAGVEVER